MIRYVFAALVLVAACGDAKDDDGYSGPCDEALSPEVEAQMAQALIDNTAARDAAVAAERVRLGVTMLRPTSLLGTTSDHSVPFKPEVDPYPKSIVVAGNLTFDIRANGYELNHGKMDKLNIYETEPGSGQYFVVDMIEGDGIGGNGSEVNAYTIEYGLTDSRAALDGFSWHSWHVSKDNVLVRATQKPEDVILGEVSICGCGPRNEVGLNLESAKDMAPPNYQIAVFMLTGSGIPKLSDDTFEAKYTRSYFKQKYVPRKGKQCVELQSTVVCLRGGTPKAEHGSRDGSTV